ncbi:hypothetical protein H1C71_001277, partial [Ictidomys tridecemlineatus]
ASQMGLCKNTASKLRKLWPVILQVKACLKQTALGSCAMHSWSGPHKCAIMHSQGSMPSFTQQGTEAIKALESGQVRQTGSGGAQIPPRLLKEMGGRHLPTGQGGNHLCSLLG